MMRTLIDWETGDVLFQNVRWTPAFLVSPATMVLGVPEQPVDADSAAVEAQDDEDAMVDALAERLGFGPGLERFDAMSAGWGHD